MQYEIISKQLTTLRDEVGPTKRLIFLELPSSFYTIPKKSDGYLVKIEWNVERYFGEVEDSNGAGNVEVTQAREYQPEPVTLKMLDKLDERKNRDGDYYLKTLLDALDLSEEKNELDAAESNKSAQMNQSEISARKKAVQEALNKAKGELSRLKAERSNIKVSEVNIDELLDSMKGDQELIELRRSRRLRNMRWLNATTPDMKGKFRTVDIIPRQSALNVNDGNGTSTGFNLSFLLQAVTGFGAKVGFQRQRDVYEQFVHQEIFASGYGKGLDKFSWTFGPLPGTTRIAPGIRTTYAVLVVPRDALALELKAVGCAYKRTESPDDGATSIRTETFKILIPDEETEGFWVDRINYTPVVQGQIVTVVMNGRYFSPQTGILVNGSPLSRAVSIGKNESIATTLAGSGIRGEYEYLGSNKIVMTLQMGPDYVGTPIITLVTPEKTAPINYFNNLIINGDSKFRSLYEVSKIEPMFVRRLSLFRAEMRPDTGGVPTLQLNGDGLRRGAKIWINEVPIPPADVSHLSTDTYEIKLNEAVLSQIRQAAYDQNNGASSLRWRIHYVQHNMQGLERAYIEYTRPTPPTTPA